jgi:glutathione S-transferase
MSTSKTDPDRLRVYTFSSTWGLPTAGPFGLKLEACLRMMNVPYDRVHLDNTAKGPKRKSPWIEDKGQRIGDTELILHHLAKTRGVSLDSQLDTPTRARGHALRRMLEEHFHQVFEYELIIHDAGFSVFRSFMALTVPGPVTAVLSRVIRSQMRKHLFERGIARHTQAEIESMGRADVDALVALLGDQSWFFGDAPVKADASAFGLLAATIKSPLQTPVCSYARAQPTLVAYVDRALTHFFPEF